jgi:hypothetical protein
VSAATFSCVASTGDARTIWNRAVDNSSSHEYARSSMPPRAPTVVRIFSSFACKPLHE